MPTDIARLIADYLGSLDCLHKKVEAINELKRYIHQHSPFREEPVDCVQWVKAEDVEANNYNPNVMASVERKLLQRSIEKDGFTQPMVVSAQEKTYMVVDGFHRQLIGKTHSHLRRRLHGYLPVTCINVSRQGEKECIAATIRHNRARGKHQITAMCDIVRELSRLGWDDGQIGEELGMDKDEVLRLKQISGLAELFSGDEFSQAWTVD